MTTLATAALLLSAFALLLPAAIVAIECGAARLPARARRDPIAARADRARMDVIVPAHDAANTLVACLAALRPQLAPADRLIVVADNCRDATAAVAHAEGAVVLVRDDPVHVGKGYALAYAVDRLPEPAPEVAIVVDADCIAGPRLLDTLARRVHTTGRPVQAAYVFEPPGDADPLTRLTVLALRVRNVVRPRGLARLGFPCLLTGSGMAFPWAALRNAPLASGRTAVDLRLTVDMALAGCPPLFEADVEVTTRVPTSRVVRMEQRLRWEHGYLETVVRGAPRLLRAALRERRPDLAVLACELGVPPLALLALLWGVTASAALGLAAVGGSCLPAALLATSGMLLGVAVVVAWRGFGRDLVPGWSLAAAPLYALRKVPLYAGFLRRSGARWTLDPPTDARVWVAGLGFHALDEAACVATVFDALAVGRGGWLLTANLQHLRLVGRDPSYAALCRHATVVVADGMPVVWASRLQGTLLPARVAGADLLGALAAEAAARGHTILLVGGAPGTAETAVALLQTRHADLRVAGALCPVEGLAGDAAALAALARAIGAAAPAVVFVGLSTPAQDRVIEYLRAQHPAAWYVGVGMGFGFLAGMTARAPGWMQRAGLEWLHRLVHEPRRLGRRYLIEGAPFALRLLGGALLERLRPTSRRGRTGPPGS